MNPKSIRHLMVSTLLVLAISLIFTTCFMLKPVNAQNITEIEVMGYPSQARPGELIPLIVTLHYSASGDFSTTLRIVDEGGTSVTEDVPVEITLPLGEHTGTILELVPLEVPEFDSYPHTWGLRAEADSISTPFEIEVVAPDSPPFVEILWVKSFTEEGERYQLHEGELFYIIGFVQFSIPEGALSEALISVKYQNSPLLYTNPHDRPAEEGWIYLYGPGVPDLAIFPNLFLPLNAPLDYPVDRWEWSFRAEVEIEGEVQASDTESLTLSVSERSYSWASINYLRAPPDCVRPEAEFSVDVSGTYSFLEGAEETLQLTVTR
ncbi:MAG: hypothetical protein QXR38_01485, partial [Nitrososphaerales archaeon]